MSTNNFHNQQEVKTIHMKHQRQTVLEEKEFMKNHAVTVREYLHEKPKEE